MKGRIQTLIKRITLSCLEKDFILLLEEDKLFPNTRLYIQIEYNSKCNKTGILDTWKGRKWYLSEFMTDDEIIKTCYTAFEAVIKHELMEGFKIDKTILFNPHLDFEELLKISNKEIKRNVQTK